MENKNYSQIYAKITKDLSSKIKEIFERRFGVKNGEPETLESIGKSFGITRERVRQIQEAGFRTVRKNHGELIEKVFNDFQGYFQEEGGFKSEEVALKELGGAKQQSYVLFFLNLGEQFSRVCQKKEHYDFWAIDEKGKEVKNNLNAIVSSLENHGKVIAKKELLSDYFSSHSDINEKSLASYIEASKIIQNDKEGKLGLSWWPEVNPRSVRHKALLVMRKHKEPLHFRDIAKLIDQSEYGRSGNKTNAQTVHNELIKDSNFVLVGRGTYALSEWGYVPGTIKDIIAKVLKEKPLLVSKEDIVKEVLNQRMVAKNTVLINLNNRKHFGKREDGKYFAREVQTA